MKQRATGMNGLLLLITVAVLSYFGLQGYQYYTDPLTSTLAYSYQVETLLDMNGYVARQEEVLANTAEGLLQLQRREGERVSTGGAVAAVYADRASLEREEQLDILQTQIEQLEFAQESMLGVEASLKLDSQILQTIKDYRGAVVAGKLETAEEQGQQLRALVTKRDYTYSGSEDLSLEIGRLQKEKKALQSQAAGTVRTITTPVAGLYSAVVDGYELALRPEGLKNLLPSDLDNLTSDETVYSAVGKMVLGDAWYYAAALPEEEAARLKKIDVEQHGQAVFHLRFAKGVERDLDVELYSVSEAEEGRCVVVFIGERHLSQLTLLRQQTAQIILETMEGLRVPKEALRVRHVTRENDEGQEETLTQTGVYCVVGAKALFKPVDVLYSGEEFVLLQGTGATEKTMLRSGDEVIVLGRDLFDGKVVG